MSDTCKTCAFWGDYTTRVNARISATRNTTYARQVIELRLCQHEPPPNADMQWSAVYTDDEHTCSAHKERVSK